MEQKRKKRVRLVKKRNYGYDTRKGKRRKNGKISGQKEKKRSV